MRLLLEPLTKIDRRWLTQWQSQASGEGTRLLITGSDSGKSWADADNGADGAHVVEDAKRWQVIEAVRRRSRPLWLFGAGHVGRALARRWPPAVRGDLARRPGRRIPGSRSRRGVGHVVAPRLAEAVENAPAGTLFLVLTHCTSSTSTSASAVLRRGDFAFLGPDRQRDQEGAVLSALKGRGHAPAALDRLVCPIGLAQFRASSLWR